ncbi:helix-turn-helix domain-containing protein [Nocardioides albus]|uniref:Transcriptional regulator with XRE-family HTH domain n=1 Tax=Nocardioides albus TaxID=1841 RepID=A0A7W5A769_9ACTN|nr:transcriptional regulator [Nocardioides albus]MBB3090783.1 transcriptional regulator with XRE-family HTH domain [Nocardioides albus]GGU37459.1 hypothetical protein GCM10007979_40580 [Nocardioides albus]
MTSVVEWSPREAEALRAALRLTNEEFAEQLGVSVRAVANWRKGGESAISLQIQRIFDTVLERATDDERERFERLAGLGAAAADGDELRRRLEAATNLHSAVGWLQGGRDDDAGAGVLAAAAQLDTATGPRWRTAETNRSAVAERLHQYYADGFDDRRPVQIDLDNASIAMTILSGADWLSRPLDLRADEAVGRFTYDHDAAVVPQPESNTWRLAAATRLAECLVQETRFVDGQLYRMTGWESRPDGVRTSFTTGSFAQYALTVDLLEAETLAAVQTGGEALPLRDLMLPTVDSVLDPGSRNCMGGALALTAFARPAQGARPADFALLIQERGAKVLNASRRLAVIPKCFHEPTSEPTWDVSVGTSLARELEEELFGKPEVDTTLDTRRTVDPMHPDLLTRPMRYLTETSPAGWSMECTGFGFNLLTGNYEFPCLVAVHDEGFWHRCGGDVESNWESERITLVSSQDEAGLRALTHNAAWSDEGLFAFVLGLRRLHELHPERVALPHFEIGFTQ